jgi:hypothetical protein
MGRSDGSPTRTCSGRSSASSLGQTTARRRSATRPIGAFWHGPDRLLGRRLQLAGTLLVEQDESAASPCAEVDLRARGCFPRAAGCWFATFPITRARSAGIAFGSRDLDAAAILSAIEHSSGSCVLSAELVPGQHMNRLTVVRCRGPRPVRWEAEAAAARGAHSRCQRLGWAGGRDSLNHETSLGLDITRDESPGRQRALIRLPPHARKWSRNAGRKRLTNPSSDSSVSGRACCTGAAGSPNSRSESTTAGNRL